jgi:CO/xanthine dehydrogenase FAD-binding subunit
VVGGLQIQNRATVAGNVVNASPAGDTLPVWAVLDAEVVLASVRGTRAVPFPEFYLGYRKLDREPDELVTGLRFSKPAPGGAWFFHKVGTRAAQAISKAVLAGRVRVAKDGTFEEVRLAAGSLAPTPVRLRTVEAALAGEPAGEESVGRALDLLDRDITPIDDIRSTRDYRMSVTRNLLAHHLLAAVRPL